MKHSFKFAALFAATLAILFAGCKPDKPEVGLEAFIKTIKITNADISGGVNLAGEVDNTKMVVTFNDVPAETHIAGVKFQGTFSLGAQLEKDVIDFTVSNDVNSKTLIDTLTVVNNQGGQSKVEKYQVVLNLKDPVSKPVIEKIVIKDDKNVEHTITSINVIDNLLCLGVPESGSATIVTVNLSPVRSTYEFTTAVEGVINSANPGFLKMDFMGLTTEYELTFSSSPVPGADFSQAVVHDFSIRTNNVYADLSEELTRGGDFDGQYVLLANRTAPKLFAVSDLLNDNTNSPINLDMTGVEGGTFVVSAGRLSHGHIYLCNLCAPAIVDTATGPFKVYHYASPTATPEVVLTWDGSGVINTDYPYTVRTGDNMSLDLDESGNGYAYFFQQEGDNKFIRFNVTGFTEFSNPTELSLPVPKANYYGMFNKVGENQYLFKSSFLESLLLLDKDGTLIYGDEFKWKASPNGASAKHGCDPRMIVFNRSRYLMLSNARRYAYWAPEALNVYDITEGNDVVSALVKLDEALWPTNPEDPEEEIESTLEPAFTYDICDADWAENGLSLGCSALCNAAEVNGKLLIWAAAPHVGMILVEVPKMK